MSKIVVVRDKNNQEIDLEMAIEQMDKFILFEVYQHFKDESPQKFYDQYCRRHKVQYRKDFEI